jgi:hypothetical protein
LKHLVVNGGMQCVKHGIDACDARIIVRVVLVRLVVDTWRNWTGFFKDA